MTLSRKIYLSLRDREMERVSEFYTHELSFFFLTKQKLLSYGGVLIFFQM